MKIYCVGKDELCGCDFEKVPQYVLFVYDYEQGDYDGNGIAVGLRQDGKYEWSNLSHCSCYGPTEDWSATEISLDNLLNYVDELGRKRNESDYDFHRWKNVIEKIKTYLKEN